MDFKETKLPNGLQVIAEICETKPSLSIGFFAKTGSRDEAPDVAGVSHFLEHMVFKGTDRRSAAEVNIAFDRMGARYNAFTSQENTVFYAEVLAEFQADALGLLCDIMRPALRADDFQTEKEVILEEIAMYRDMPPFRLHDGLMAAHFDGHPLSRPVLGTRESITELRIERMKEYFLSRYCPSNMTLAATGNVAFDELVETAGRLSADWPDYNPARTCPPCDGSGSRAAIRDGKLSRENIGLMAPGPAATDEDRHAAMLASYLLGDTTGSRFYHELVETALADEAHMTCSPMDGTGVMMTFISCSPENTAPACERAAAVIDAFLADGPADDELLAAKNKMATGATIKTEQPLGRLPSLGLDWVYRSRYEPVASQIERIYAVTADEVLRVARDCRLTAPTALFLGPLAEPPV